MPIAGLALLLAVAYFEALRWMIFRWPLEPYSGGGFLIPPVSFYLVWLKRDKLMAMPLRGSNWGLLVLAIGAAIFFIGSWTGIHYPYAFSLIVVLWGLVLWLAGVAIAMELLFPIAFLVFMIPLSWALDALTFPLRLLATRAAAWLPQAIGLPTVVDGTDIHVGDYSLLIDLPCSGLRFVLALMAGAALFAYFLEARLWRKITLFISAIPIAVLANVIRIDATLLLGKSFGQEVAQGFFHNLSGIAIFAFALVCLFYLSRLLCPANTRAG
jgi:exosortase